MTKDASPLDLVFTGGEVFTPDGLVDADVGVRKGRIAEIGKLAGAKAIDRIDCAGLTLLPGAIDTQVHFREPGNEHKEDLSTGTAAAALGGITAICEMPNTKPPTTTPEALADKLARAKGRAWVDHAFFVGATPENADHVGDLEKLPGCVGIKMFMGSSTGTLLVADDATVARVLASGSRRIAVHAEDEARLIERKALATGSPINHPVWRDAETARRATERLIRLARIANRRVHVLHTTTAEEMVLLKQAKDIATVEVTPQHLTLVSPDCYERLGTFAQMNPPIRDAGHRAALWRAIDDGTVDVIGSDHAPHTREEKAQDYPNTPSGMPGVQTLLPLMMDHMAAGRLSLARLVDLTSAAPARIYGMLGKGAIAEGFDADLSIVDLKAKKRITNQWIASRCGWTPFDGMQVTGWPEMTVIRGKVVMRDGALLGDPTGMPLRFEEMAAR
jgi:dihydroorotase